MKHIQILRLVLCAGSLLVAPVSVQAQASSNSDDWQFTGNIYLWGAGIEGMTRGGKEIDVSFSDLLENLDFAFMGGLEARKSKWFLLGDLNYLKLSHDQGATLPSGANLRTDAEVDAWVVNLIGGYNLSHTSNGLLDVFIGARYFDLEATINASLSGGAGIEVSRSGNVLDGIVGIRGKQNINDKWYLRYYLDIGAGDSDETWQAVAGVGYRLERWDLSLAYRHLEWEFKSDRKIDNLNFSGPGFLAQYHF